jgi:acetylornithine deacetylase/succinyl-diaminopimelate desuccinylase-like protein
MVEPGAPGQAGPAREPGGADLRATVRRLMPRLVADLSDLVGIPSVYEEGRVAPAVRQAGEAVLALLHGAGITEARFVDVAAGVPPLIHAEHRHSGAPDATPTVLLYAHYDVQPAGPWKEAFSPHISGGRLVGRGAADDKSGIAMHLGALRAFGGHPPVHVKVAIEGEEEVGRGSLERFAADPANRDLFSADVVVVADTGNAALGVPTITTSLRGLAAVDVTVRTLEGPVHSGMYGGAAPDAFMCLVRMLAGLHDARGDVAVPGLASIPWTGADVPEERYRRDAGVLPGVGLAASGSIGQRLYASPAINVVGLDGVPALAGSTNALRDQVTARLSVRLAPGQDPESAIAALSRHLETLVPWHARLTVTPAGHGEGYLADTSRPGYAVAEAALQAAYPGTEVRYAGQGGAIPLVNILAGVNPGATILLWGCEEPMCRIHAPGESVDLGELEAMTHAEAELLARLAGPAAGGASPPAGA